MQALRSSPPGKAGTDPERRLVFGAALQQCGELLAAAGASGPASAPLPLFYALSQAGRAIAAARCPDARWDFKGHGLMIKEDTSNIGASLVIPKPHKTGSDAFSVVADATGSGVLTASIELGTLWASLPDVEVIAGLGVGEPRPLHVAPKPGSRKAVSAELRIPAAAASTPPAFRSYMQPYPQADGCFVMDSRDVALLPDAEKSNISVLLWRDDDGAPRQIRDVCGTYLGDLDTYLWPGIGPSREILSPLMTWWAVLLALSQLARYVPAAWTEALNRDGSVVAIPIETGLERARRIIPRLVLHAITGSWRA